MAITAEDINNQSFSIDRKGYDVDEVDEFLEFVATEIGALNDTIADLRKQLDEKEVAPAFEALDNEPVGKLDDEPVNESDFDQPTEFMAPVADSAALAEKDAVIADLRKQLEEKRANDNAIAQALIIAQRTADETRAKAEDDADQIIADAHEQATNIVDAATKEKNEIEDEIASLDEQCEEIRGRFQEVLKDFINDATTKLADISDASIMASAHARANKAAARNYETPTYTPRTAEPVASAAMDYSTPVIARDDNAVVAPATPMAYAGERDLSGFGDAAADDEFDDLD